MTAPLLVRFVTLRWAGLGGGKAGAHDNCWTATVRGPRGEGRSRDWRRQVRCGRLHDVRAAEEQALSVDWRGER